jgi:hypothetical protein
MRKVSSKAVLIGGIVDVVLSSLFGVPFVIFVIAARGLARLPKSRMHHALVQAIHTTLTLFAIQLTIGMVCTIIGGFIAGRLAKHDQPLNGLLSSGVCVAIGLYSLAAGKAAESLLIQLLLLLVVTPFCGVIGGYLAKPRQEPPPNY